MREPTHIPTARELMSTSLLTFRTKQTILAAMQALLKSGVSGGPVVDEDGRLVGVLSELDCLRMLASDEFYLEQQEEGGLVEHHMTSGGRTIPADLGIYAIAHYFLTSPIRRLPVVEDGELVGQVSRRDVLRGMEEMSRKRLVRKRYPDYLQLAEGSLPSPWRLRAPVAAYQSTPRMMPLVGTPVPAVTSMFSTFGT